MIVAFISSISEASSPTQGRFKEKEVIYAQQDRIEAVAACQYGVSGSVGLRIDSRHISRRFNIPCPFGTFPDTDSKTLRPVLRFIATPQCLWLMVTLSEVSGVYGYRRLLIYQINGNEARLAESEFKLEFSDFGSWTFDRKQSQLTVWDALLQDEEPHEGPHRFSVSQLKWDGAKFSGISKRKTTQSYDLSWATDGQRPRKVRRDPLREFGITWRWWGE